MDATTRDLVRRRAADRREYCRMPQQLIPFIAFHVEHIIAKQHLDVQSDNPSGLAFACDRCNAFKGPNLSSLDPETGDKVDLFNPRNHVWTDHFAVVHGTMIGLTPIGQATARLLNMNAPRRVDLRRQWLAEGGTF